MSHSQFASAAIGETPDASSFVVMLGMVSAPLRAWLAPPLGISSSGETPEGRNAEFSARCPAHAGHHHGECGWQSSWSVLLASPDWNNPQSTLTTNLPVVTVHTACWGASYWSARCSRNISKSLWSKLRKKKWLSQAYLHALDTSMLSWVISSLCFST